MMLSLLCFIVICYANDCVLETQNDYVVQQTDEQCQQIEGVLYDQTNIYLYGIGGELTVSTISSDIYIGPLKECSFSHIFINKENVDNSQYNSIYLMNNSPLIIDIHEKNGSNINLANVIKPYYTFNNPIVINNYDCFELDYCQYMFIPVIDDYFFRYLTIEGTVNFFMRQTFTDNTKFNNYS